MNWTCLVGIGLFLRDVADVRHVLDDVVASSNTPLKVAGAVWLVVVGGLEHASEVSSLGNVEVLRAGAEVILRSCFNSVDLVSKENQVQISGEDILLRNLVFKRNCKSDFTQLALHRNLGGLRDSLCIAG